MLTAANRSLTIMQEKKPSRKFILRRNVSINDTNNFLSNILYIVTKIHKFNIKSIIDPADNIQ